MREAGATARQMILNVAAEQWAVPVGELSTENSVVMHAASQRSATYGELAAQAATLAMPAAEQVKLKSPSQFRMIGKKSAVKTGVRTTARPFSPRIFSWKVCSPQ
ncbi:hypothetical protein [Aliamphritea spongicola]|nr:hypothetical protein [Aliamphritea spongicola]